MDPAATPAEDTAAAAPADPQQLARQRRRAIWLAVTLAVLAVAGSAAWLFNVVTTERTLHAVTSAALPALPAEPAALPPAAPPPASAPPAPAGPVAAGTAALAVAASAAAPPAPPAPPAQSPGTPATSAPAAGAPAARAPAATAPAAAQPVRQAAQVRKPGRRPAVRRVAKRKPDSATFRRCPPLGQAGAVMCRWHICNGAAGKEAACRPYLERQP